MLLYQALVEPKLTFRFDPGTIPPELMLIVLKLPKNYDIEFLYETITKYNYKHSLINIYLYVMNKMLIFVLENVFIPPKNT